MYINKFNVTVFVFLSCLVGALSPCQAQVRNGEFDDQTGTNLHWWYSNNSNSGGVVARTTEQAYNGTYSALVSGRTDFWNGIGQSLDGEITLTVGKDYHFQCWVRTKDVPSGVLRIEIAQQDDRETDNPNDDQHRYFPIAKVLANDSSWTLLEGGFHLMVNGTLDDLRFTISGDYTDNRPFDFYVDAVTITENDWRAAADQRIEQLRKRDVVLEFEDIDGNAISDVAVDIQQIGHQFAFGSTLNDGFTDNSAYADFFKQNFEWATIEYFAQWKPVEEVQGVEDYSRADPSIEFTEANGIQLRGHSLAWPDTRFVPSWLFNQSAQVHRNEINERIDNVVSRYADTLVHWDVINEMLNYTYYQDNAGSDIRAAMFKRARENDPDVKLFTNEFGLTDSGLKASRYRELLQGLQAAGADVGGIGLQSHFDSNVSPKALELTLAKLTDLGPEIWFTEFDVSNPDPNERAKLLETFYRYAFSVPEAEGIIMWGFWAGNHWRGADSALLDQDFTPNAAWQMYSDLMDEWTTELTAGGSKNQSQFAFRGFQGTYKITTTDSDGVVSDHLIKIEPGTGASQNVRLILSSEANGFLTVYGTAGDDLIEFDYIRPNRVSFNGDSIVIPNSVSNEMIQIAGLGGDDTLNIAGAEVRQNYVVGVTGVKNSSTGQSVLCNGIDNVNFSAGNATDRVVVLGTPAQELFYSFPDSTICQYANKTLSVTNFENVLCRSNGGNDIGMISDSEEFDYLNSNFSDFLSIRSGANLRRFYDFGETIFRSSGGNDFLAGMLTSTATNVTATLENLAFSSAVSSFQFLDLQQASIDSDPLHGHTLTADVSANNSSDRIYKYFDVTTLNQSRLLRHTFKGFTDVDFLGDQQDRLFMEDSSFNDNLVAESDQVILSGGGRTVTANNFRVVAVNGLNGGVNTSDVRGTSYDLYLPGVWIDAGEANNF
ncbi:endo-1,4-beta-xylanase [bacterium]|nr:endo-1,4-beta-xylanase [bacterium]